MKKIIAVLTGAGISAESGISTFRDSNGLWENHDVKDVASPTGWHRNKKLVLDFYNARRKQLFEVEPNNAHKALVQLEQIFDVNVITQNVDDLHERAGSTNILHLHGELRKVCSTKNPNLIYHWEKDCIIGDLAEDGGQLRPHVVWFGELVPMLKPAAELVSKADIILIVGTSMQVYPAAGLVGYADKNIPVFYIDPKPQLSSELIRKPNLTVIEKTATDGMEEFLKIAESIK